MNAQHSGLRKYACEFCLKTFVSSGNCEFNQMINFLFLYFSVLDYSHRKRMHPAELKKKLKDKEINEHKQRLEVQKRKLIGK